MPTYSFKNVVGAFSDPDAGSFPFVGQEGVKQLTVGFNTERGVLDTAADGTIMVSYVAGASAFIDIETQQTSVLHSFLVNWANIKFTQADNADGANFAATAIKVVDTLNGAVHILTGVFPVKIPDKTYGAQGGMLTWKLLAANMQTL